MTINSPLSLKIFSNTHPSFTVGGLRHLIRNQFSNGLFESHAVVRIGRRVLIDQELFFAWVKQQNGAA